MIQKAAFLAAALGVVGSPALAQGFTGGTLGVKATTTDGASDYEGTSYFGGGEYSINRSFGIAADASTYNFDGDDFSSWTLHGIYHMSNEASVGLFYGMDLGEGNDDAEFVGLEGGTEFMGGNVEGYVATVIDDGEGTMFGIDGEYAYTNQIAFTASAGFATADDNDISRFALGGSYTFNSGPQLFAEIGSLSVEDDSETFLGLGARINFGASRGTTFDQRSFFETVTSF